MYCPVVYQIPLDMKYIILLYKELGKVFMYMTLILPKIIGIAGRSRCGKDTIAQIIIDKYPQYKIRRLSEPLKIAVTTLYDYTPEQLESDAKESIDDRWGKTPRETMQSFTDYMMSYMGHDFFTKQLYFKYKSDEYIIIPDIRYEHDVHEIKKRNGIVIKVERPSSFVSHDFEKHIDNLTYHYFIKNNGTIEQLQNCINQLLGD